THPLRVGLSMEATVDVAEQRGTPLVAAAAVRDSSRTEVFAPATAEADRRVRAIIAAHGGGKAALTTSP
ncbi:MAG: hypothetical protein RIQ53_1959, partial [Pseudomonadota bacterium]